MAGNPESPHWWMRPIGLEELIELQDLIKSTQEKGLGYAGIHMNRIQVALEELRERKEKEER